MNIFYTWMFGIILGFGTGYAVGHTSGIETGRSAERAITDNAWSQAREMKLCEFPAAIYQSVKCGSKP